jgi:glyoxylase-like metal-dependent hydrolase (beta-lactamase superfamily II)
MRVRDPGKICDGLWCLGREESRVYLLEGRDASMIISGGVSYIVPEVLRQMERFAIEERRIAKLLILHSHFDHVGIVPFFKRRHPDMEICASARAWEVLRMPKAIETINQFSRMVAARMDMEEACSSYDLEWRDDITGRTVSDGEVLDLGDIHVQILETPGHSSCCLAAYVPLLKALFPSDGAGIPFKETIVAAGNSNYTQYQRSLERLGGLDVRYLCADHYAHIVGQEARDFISRCLEVAEENRAEMAKVYGRTRDVEAAARELNARFHAEHPDYFLSPEIFEGIYRQMVRHIAKSLEGT